jgi:hypothetical protein
MSWVDPNQLNAYYGTNPQPYVAPPPKAPVNPYYQYLNTNNNQTADLSYNANAKALIDSLMAGTNITHSYFNPAYSRDEDGNLTQNQRTNENGQLLYQVGSGDDISYVTDPTDRTYLNGYEVSPAGENQYSVGIDDPTSKGYFNINAKVDPNTNKLSGLGSTYGSHGHFNYLNPLLFAALVGGGLLAAPALGGASLFGGEALAGGAVAGAGDAFLPGALAYTDPAVASSIASEVASQVAPVAGALAPEVASPLASLPAEVPLPIEPSPINTLPQQALDDLIAKQQMFYPTVGDTTVGLPQVGNSILQGAGKGAVTSALSDLAQNKPITLQDVATGALTGGVGGGAGSLAGQFGGGAIGAGIAGGASGSATGALINGGDVGSSALKGALTGGISGATSDVLQGLPSPVVGAGKSIANGLTNAIVSGNTNNLGTNLVTGALGSAGLTAVNSVIPPLSSILSSQAPTPQTPAPLNTLSSAELNAINTPYDTTQYPTYNPVASAPTGTTTQDTVVPNQSPLSVEGLPNITANSPSGIYNNPVGETSSVGQTPVNPVVDNLDGTQSVKLPDGTVNTYDANDVFISSTPPANNDAVINSTLPANNTIDFSPINNQLSTLTNNQQGLTGTVNDVQGALGSLTNQVNTNQDNINQQIANLTTEQQKAVASQVAMGVDLNSAIANVKQSLGDTNAQIANYQNQNNTQFGQVNNQLGALQTNQQNLSDQFNSLSDLQKQQFEQLTNANVSASDALKAVTNQLGNFSQKVDTNQTKNQQQFDNVNNQINSLNTGINNTNQSIDNASAQEKLDYQNLNANQKAQTDALVNQGVTFNNAINQVQSNLSGQIGGLQTSQTDLATKINNLSDSQRQALDALTQKNVDVATALNVVTGQVGDLTKTFDASNQNNQNQFNQIGNQLNSNQAQNQQQFDAFGNLINTNQATTNQALQSLSDAQKTQAEALIAQGASTNDAINAVQSNLQGQLGGLTNQVTENQQTTNQNLSTLEQNLVKQLTDQGMSTQDAINKVANNFGSQVNDLSNVVASNQNLTNAQLQNLNTQQQDTVKQLIAQGVTTQDAIQAVTGNVNNLSNSVNDVKSSVNATNQNVSNVSNQVADLSTKYDNLNDSQKAIVDQLTQQGVSANNAINAVQQGLNSTNTNFNNKFNYLSNQATVTLGELSDLNNQVTSNQDANKASFNDLNNQFGGLNTGLSNLSGTVGGLGTGLSNLTGTVGGLGNSLNDTNTNFNNKFGELSNQVNSNQIATDQKLANLTTAQQEQVANEVAQGKELAQAIDDVQQGLTSSINTNQATNAIAINGINQNIGALQSTVNNTNATNKLASLNKALTPTSLYTGDLLKNTNILQTLQQLDPKLLSKIAPHLSPQQSTPENAALPSSTQSTQYNGLMSSMLSGHDVSGNLMSAGNSLLSGGSLPGYKSGGHVDNNAPVFITGETGHYVKGRGDGQSDDIPAMLADGEYVFDADTVAQLGNGSSDAGAKLLDHFRESLREHKRSAPAHEIPPEASPLSYMKEALKRHKKG